MEEEKKLCQELFETDSLPLAINARMSLMAEVYKCFFGAAVHIKEAVDASECKHRSDKFPDIKAKSS
jgi:hypothetical protein